MRVRRRRVALALFTPPAPLPICHVAAYDYYFRVCAHEEREKRGERRGKEFSKELMVLVVVVVRRGCHGT